ncbi:sigma factor-like helix-turn-helix DNA-binding protein [Ktedonobacter sp. SOSP1-52]|uniref:sigma factor-like helix-turn-helix DNA-binding protein n=1 Tax=Ktedonobacter sp. SOSP1-52 TaxID=2778366 RepID=UPI0035AFBEE8
MSLSRGFSHHPDPEGRGAARARIRADPREQLVLQLRFGLGNGQAHPLEQVGRELGITRERVRQIEAGALAKLRQPPVLERLRG